ncbi:hypothetical protein NHX12_015223, partial [Muraenolepis orangiensis]
MKVTVTFGDTAVVVPCKDGWTVQYGEYVVRTHHLEYDEGGILDMDDPLYELVEDKDR